MCLFTLAGTLAKTEVVLKQARDTGERVKRRPHAKFIAEIARRGIPTIEYFGSAIVRDGHLDTSRLLRKPKRVRVLPEAFRSAEGLEEYTTKEEVMARERTRTPDKSMN